MEMFNYEFMQNAVILILIISPLFGLISTLVVNNKLAYFSDALGHSAYMGISIGILLGIAQTSVIPLILFSLLFSIILVLIKKKSKESSDTIIGIISSISVAGGIAILSRYGGFQKFSKLLVGDLLLVSKSQLIYFGILAVVIAIVLKMIFNKMILINIDRSLAKSKKINPIVYEMIFTSIIAITVSISINIIGILLISSLFILPGAASKNISRNLKNYVIFSVLISVISGIIGLVLSYYLVIPAGSSVILTCGAIYILTSIPNLTKQNL